MDPSWSYEGLLRGSSGGLSKGSSYSNFGILCIYQFLLIKIVHITCGNDLCDIYQIISGVLLPSMIPGNIVKLGISAKYNKSSFI